MYPRKPLLLRRQHRYHLLIDPIMLHIHKVGLNIQLQNVRLRRIVAATRTDKLFRSLHSIVCSLPHSATVCIVDQFSINDRIDASVDEMVDDPVGKIRSEDLPNHRLTNNKCYTLYSAYFGEPASRLCVVDKEEFQRIPIDTSTD
jgi:hypothetical protein